MKDGFLKAAALSPALRVADCAYNTRQILTELRAAAARGVKLAVFPEFCLTGYTCGDLFLQRTLQQGALTGLQELLDASRELDTVALVGLPLMVRGKLYNCAAVFCRGQLLGLVPKTYLPNYGEFYEKRQFTPGSTEVEWVNVCGQDVPFGTSLLFRCRQMPSFVLGVELCEDLWSALPPSTFHALAGATVIANLSASDETVGKAEYRRALVENQSARLLCGYLYASAGHGESTQDMVFAGHDLIAENGTLLAEVKKLADDSAVHGILVQLPLPKHIDEEKVLDSISPLKDVDGFHPQNVGALCIGKPGFVSCTPAGVIQMLKRSGIEIAGKECVVVGRSNIVGKPMALLLLRENGTVTVAHSRTKDLKEVTKRADILVVAVGKPKMITAEYVKEGAVVIDVGIHRNEENKLCGDVDFDSVEPVCSAITPVPGGVGPMTIAMLMNNCLESVSLQAVRG